jgi:DNA topoisomerase-1
MRLRRWDPAEPAILRRRRGRGFSYVDVDGTPLTDGATLQRIRDLVIPPAWQDVRICPWPNGHLQAVGADDAGRRQYLYHPVWREQRDREKFQHIRSFGEQLPEVRNRVAADLSGRGLTRARVLASAVRLLDIGFFRVGGEQYTEENGSYGLATILCEHVQVRRGGTVVFEYPAKSGQERVQAVGDETLLAYYQRPTWTAVRSSEINEHLHELFDDDVSAKDFRTWHGTVLAAVCLAERAGAKSATARRRAQAQAIREVSTYLGNTPAVCRASYIDPAVLEAFEQGETIEPGLPAEAAEAAVLRLLDGR